MKSSVCRTTLPLLALTGTLLLAGCATPNLVNVAMSPAEETLPAVAYNNKTKEFLVAYLERQTKLAGCPPDCPLELRVKRFDAKGKQIGNVIYPFGIAAHKAISRPAIAYNPKTNTFVVAVAESLSLFDRVLARPLNAQGAPQCCPEFLFESLKSYFYPGSSATGGHRSLNITYNAARNEFVVSGQFRVMKPSKSGDWFSGVWAHRTGPGGGPIGTPMALYETAGSFDSHGLAHAPVQNTMPPGGRYLLVNGLHAQLFDATLKPILVTEADPIKQPGKLTSSVIPLNRGVPGGHFSHSAVAYGEVQGKKRFLIVYADDNNCWPTYSSCKTDQMKQWHGVWGTYVDPTRLSYPGKPLIKEGDGHNTPFPISKIDFTTTLSTEYHPVVTYLPASQDFFVAWRDISANNPKNPVKTSHIRGVWVDKFIPDNTPGTSIPLPHDNIAPISPVSGSCLAPGRCLSAEDPDMVDAAPGGKNQAIVVWRQKHPTKSGDLDVRGAVVTFP